MNFLLETIKMDLQAVLEDAHRLKECETAEQNAEVMEAVVRDMRFLTEKYQDMVERLRGTK